MIKYTDFFDLIYMDKESPVAALFMTYGFDADIFENHVLSSFLGVIGNVDENEMRFRNQIALKLKEIPVTVISDSNQFDGGRTFLYDHITINKHTFHPKCYLLLYENYLRIIVGSCNITKSGLCYNAETIWYEDINLENKSSISSDLIIFLKWISKEYKIKNNDSIKEISKFLEKIKVRKDFPKICSTTSNKNIFDQIFDEIKEIDRECKEVSIISPFYENDRDKAVEKALLLDFANKFKSIYPYAKIKIYFNAIKDSNQNKYKVNVPINIFDELCKKYRDTSLYAINREWERGKQEPVPRSLHAKIIRFKFEGNKNLILSGSVNFTNNAMRSKLGKMRNIEIGILEYGNIKFPFPKSNKVKIKDIIFQEKKEDKKSITIFVESAILDKDKLTAKFNTKKDFTPFTINYNDRIIYESKDLKYFKDEIIIENFKLERVQDLQIKCDDFIFFVPIQILNKEDFITEDLKISFELEMKDIVDYLAGKYRNFSEISQSKRNKIDNEDRSENKSIIYFRYNLQKYFKAMDSLKQGLEQPYYSELAFKNHLNNPIGLKNLLNLITEEYEKKTARDEETFLFLIEIENVVQHLNFQKDTLEAGFKEKKLNELMKESRFIMKSIYKKSKNKVKRQYSSLSKGYGMDMEWM